MRVFVAGATGAVGRNLLPRLVAAGHQVVGTTRTEERAPLIRQLGGEALVADGLDPKAMRRAVQSAKPDAIVHEMTDLKGASDLRHFDRSFAISNRCAPRERTICSPQLERPGSSASWLKASAGGPMPGPVAPSGRRKTRSTPSRRRNSAAPWRRSAIWKR